MAEGVYRLEGKNALVTGSSRGIGKGIAIRLAQEGCNIVIDYREKRDHAEDTAKQVEAAGRRAVLLQADVSRTDDTRRLIDEATKQLGPIDFLVKEPVERLRRSTAWLYALTNKLVSKIPIRKYGNDGCIEL